MGGRVRNGIRSAGDGGHDAADALGELRRARRRRRMGETSWSDAAYRVYVTALVSVVVVIQATSMVGDEPLSPDATAEVARSGAHWIGLAVAVIVAASLRAAGRGGPLALEAPDVHHVLQAPIDRGLVLRAPADRVLGRALVWGGLAGALGGDLAAQRLPGATLAWVGSGALVGATTALAATGAALVASGRRAGRWSVAAIGTLVVAWAMADLALGMTTSPTTVLAEAGTWPLGGDIGPLGLVVVSAALVVLGRWSIGGASIEAARRRTALVGQLRFAVAQRDLRTVVLLRRQLAAEAPRRRRWFPPLPARVGDHLPVLARDVDSYARWPIARVARMAALGAGAGLAAHLAWAGTTVAIVPAGVALFVAALDAIEPLAQELDHNGVSAFPVEEGALLFRHLGGPVIVMVLTAAVGVVAAFAAEPSSAIVVGGLVLALPVATAAVAGAATSVASEPLVAPEDEELVPPELGGPRLLLKMVWPPAVAVISLLPIRSAARAVDAGRPPLEALVGAMTFTTLICVVVLGWFRFRRSIMASMAAASAGSTSGRGGAR